MLPEFPGQTLSPLAHQSYRSQMFLVEPAGSILKYRPGGGAEEARMLSWLESHHFSSPPLLGTGPDWILMGKIAGEVQDPANLETYASLGEILGKLNRLPSPFPEVETMTMEGCCGWADYCLERTQFLGLSERLRSALQPLYECADPGPSGVIHNGPFWKNVLVDPEGTVAGLIDWEYALVGPSVHQVGTALAFIAHPGKPASQRLVRRRQQAFLEGYGENRAEPTLRRSFEVLRLLDGLSKAYRQIPYQPDDYLSPQQPAETRAEYQRLIRMQAELELRFLLDCPGP